MRFKIIHFVIYYTRQIKANYFLYVGYLQHLMLNFLWLIWRNYCSGYLIFFLCIPQIFQTNKAFLIFLNGMIIYLVHLWTGKQEHGSQRTICAVRSLMSSLQSLKLMKNWTSRLDAVFFICWAISWGSKIIFMSFQVETF